MGTSLESALNIFDRIVSTSETNLNDQWIKNNRLFVELLTLGKNLDPSLECTECEEPTNKFVCDSCFEEVVSKYQRLSREQREITPPPEALARRFQFPAHRFVSVLREMKDEAKALSVGLNQRDRSIRNLAEIGMEIYTRSTTEFFREDLNFAESELHLPAVDPYPGRDGLTTLQSIPLMLPVAAFFIDTVDDALRRKQQAARRPEWRPESVYSLMATVRGVHSESISLLAECFVEEFLASIGQSTDPYEWAKSVSHRWQPLHPLPATPDEFLTPRAAEEYVRDLLAYLGEAEAEVTRYSQDGGLDVRSKNLAVQVKHQSGSVGPQVVREIFGVAASEGRRAAVFAKSGFTASALEFGHKNGVLLFQYLPRVTGRTPGSAKCLEIGIPNALGLD